ncbi:MAG TPA: ActS/PrrB/RegB family redox-sensitive histidine kinase [Dongiaceae bacterium]|jgi:two-component system sensor histidine kinase RegB
MTTASGNLNEIPTNLRVGAAGLTAERGRVRLRTLIAIRWIAAFGQASALIVTYFGLGYRFPLVLALAVVGSSVLVNILATVGRRATQRLSDRAAAMYLGFDLVQLAALLFLTGGLHNPFALLILAPITVSATILSRFSTVALSLLGIVILMLLGAFHLPLPWKSDSFALEPLFVTGLAIALGLSVVFIAVYVFSVAEEARRMSAALSASYMALDREQRLSSLGALAAAAAHRLGSPLGTIAVVAKELARDLPADNPMRGDVDLLLSETQRCRDILTELSQRPESSAPWERLPIVALVETAAGPYRSDRVKLTISAAPFSSSADKLGPPTVPPSPALLHGLGNLLQNAMEFARSEVRVLVGWDDRQVMVTIKDDGPGFAPGVLDHLGEPYMSGGVQGRVTSSEPMGLGVFISQTLLEQTDARLHFANGANGGGEVTATWDRARLQGNPA